MAFANFGSKLQLVTTDGWNLAVCCDKIVRGTQNVEDCNTFLEICTGGDPGLVRIKCVQNGIYLAMNGEGKLYGETDVNNDETIFKEEMLENAFNVYSSKKYEFKHWYIGLKKKRTIAGPDTSYRRKECHFLPRRN